jgi:prefoldin subunit 5
LIDVEHIEDAIDILEENRDGIDRSDQRVDEIITALEVQAQFEKAADRIISEEAALQA